MALAKKMLQDDERRWSLCPSPAPPYIHSFKDYAQCETQTMSFSKLYSNYFQIYLKLMLKPLVDTEFLKE